MSKHLYGAIAKTINISGLMVIAVVLASCLTGYGRLRGEQLKKRSWTVADDVRLAQFDDLLSGTSSIVISPDEKLAAVRVQRGLLEKDLLQDEIRVYKLSALRQFVDGAKSDHAPVPVWSFVAATYSEGQLISKMRWARNSTGLAFLLEDARGRYQLMLTDLKRPRPQLLSLKGQDVFAFDIRDSTHYVYSVRHTSILHTAVQDHSLPAVDETGKSFVDDFFPRLGVHVTDRSELWAAVGDHPHAVLRKDSDEPIILYDEGQRSMALSPNGDLLALALPLPRVPQSWVTQFQPPEKNYPYRIHAGYQSLQSDTSTMLVSHYVTVDLRTGRIHSLTNGPTGRAAGWTAGGIAQIAWSSNGHLLALPSTFLAGEGKYGSDGKPCLAVADLDAGTVQCVERVRAPRSSDGKLDPEYFFIDRLRFRGSSLAMQYRQYDQTRRLRTFADSRGTWKEDSDTSYSVTFGPIDLFVHQGLNDPPILMARDEGTGKSREIWNPNPQLESVEVDEASVYRWKDADGRQWTGGLYKPPDYVPGRRYPLVIQTHGFNKKMFLPSGTMSTAFAARALAAAGIVVLQVKGCPAEVSETLQEASCNVQGYEAAIDNLATQGIIDPQRIGIIGFSRTCYYVLQALTLGGVPFEAASITDGVDYGYWQYLLTVDLNHSIVDRESEAIYGAKPFGTGLQEWLKHSPEFNITHVHTPLLIVGEGQASLLSMWEPYAALRALGRPVDLVLLHTDEHILSNPAVLMASQSGSVDWFRFWLQGYEDPNPANADQYRRWEALCAMQRDEHPNAPAFCVEPKPYNRDLAPRRKLSGLTRLSRSRARQSCGAPETAGN